MKKPRWWEAFWEENAPIDFMRLPWQLIHPARKKVYELSLKYGDSVLDVACGTGIDYLGFTERGMKYVGVDITPKFVTRFKELHPEADVSVGSSLSLLFEDASFPTVYAGGLIQHMEPTEYPQAIREMWRVCEKAVILTTSKQFTRKGNIIQKVQGGKVYDNHYGMPLFLDIIRSLPQFRDVKFYANFGGKDRGEPYTIVEIMKRKRT